jgi:hypothetical protein
LNAVLGAFFSVDLPVPCAPRPDNEKESIVADVATILTSGSAFDMENAGV